MTDLSHIRNFSIIAHIDHGKSTLADRLLEECHSVEKREMEDQILDSMELERERGITIKARAVRLDYRADDGEKYVLNLIDTPGHVDFNYEVSRSLSACEGAVLVVDASQGIEAQTLANTYLAVDNGLEVLPVVNKIDLPAARPAEVKKEIEDVIGIPAMDAPEISAKNGINIHSVLEMIVKNVPAPTGDREAPLQCLIFDSQYDSYRGAIVYLRVVNGTVYPGMDIRMMASGAVYKVVEVGYLHPKGMIPAESLGAGEVGYLTASIKTVSDTRVGDTITGVENPAAEALPGYHQAQPMVFSGVYPADGSKYGDLRDALEKLKLNDASMSFTQENSIALGFGFRCGFLGLLHMEIILERLEREYNLDLITTAPNVVYKITKTDGTQLDVYTPLNYPDPAEIAEAQEPYAKANLIAPPEYVGAIMDLCQNRRGEFKDMQYLDPTRVELHYSMPLNEIIYDFFDALKSRTRGYGSLDYELEGYRPSKLVKLDIIETNMGEREHLLANLALGNRFDAFRGARNHPHGQGGMPVFSRRILVDCRNKQGWRVFAIIHEHLLAIHEQTSVNGANRRLHARCIRTRIRLGNCKSECKASRILIFKANRVGLRRTRESLENLKLEEIVLERQGRTRNARQFLEHENLRKQVVMNVIATMDDAKPIEIEIDERLHDFIRQAHIAAPLRNRLFIKVILAKFAHLRNKHAIGIAQHEIHCRAFLFAQPRRILVASPLIHMFRNARRSKLPLLFDLQSVAHSIMQWRDYNRHFALAHFLQPICTTET